MTPERWQRVIRLLDQAYKDYEDGLVALRKQVVNNMRRKLKEGGVLDPSRLEQSSPGERPGSAAPHPRPRARRSRG